MRSGPGRLKKFAITRVIAGCIEHQIGPYFVHASIRDRITHMCQDALRDVVAKLQLGTIPLNVALQRPKYAEHGDYTTPIALGLARMAQAPPRQMAQALADALNEKNTQGIGLLARIEVAGAGHLNFKLAQKALITHLKNVIASPETTLKSSFGQNKPVLVEFVSANPTGPLHVAHGRGAVMGDVICRMLDASGHKVTREYYINDVGQQTDVMARSIFVRYQELCGRTVATPAEFYPGSYVIDIAKELHNDVGETWLDARESMWLAPLKERGIASMMARIKEDLNAFGVTFDTWVSERVITKRADPLALVKKLQALGHAFEENGKVWFKSTAFGDDKDRVLLRDDGRPTYFLGDVAYHADKAERSKGSLINIFGADHGGYVARIRAGLAALGHDPKSLRVILVQMVSLSAQGQSVKMGKRLGTAVWLREVIDQAGKDATRFLFLMRRADSQMDFDVDLATQKSLDNPVYYAQMGHARLASIERRAFAQGITLPAFEEEHVNALTLPEERNLLFAMSRAKDVVADAANALEPHHVVHYLQELIAEFHSYYSRYKNTERIISDDFEKTLARLFLCRGLKLTLKALLDLLGVDAPDAMHLQGDGSEVIDSEADETCVAKCVGGPQ